MAGIKLLEEMGWTTDPELAELPYGLVDQMSSRSPEEQAALSIVVHLFTMPTRVSPLPLRCKVELPYS